MFVKKNGFKVAYIEKCYSVAENHEYLVYSAHHQCVSLNRFLGHLMIFFSAPGVDLHLSFVNLQFY
jgi:hypothetical protein